MTVVRTPTGESEGGRFSLKFYRAKLVSMKGLSVVVTVLLFVVAVALSARLKRARVVPHQSSNSVSSDNMTLQTGERTVRFVGAH